MSAALACRSSDCPLTSAFILRLKDIEWVEKHLDGLRKKLRGATGTANLADKAKKEEVVRDVSLSQIFAASNRFSRLVGLRCQGSRGSHCPEQGRPQGCLEQQGGEQAAAAGRIAPLTRSHSQIDIVNDLQLLTAKPVIYLVNLSERDYIRKKNKWCVVAAFHPSPFLPG